jgi:hypothetical protein
VSGHCAAPVPAGVGLLGFAGRIARSGMLQGVQGAAARPAPAQLRSAPRLAALRRAALPASRCSQRFGRRARLGQGCAPRLVAAAAEGEPEPAAPRSARKPAGGEAGQAEPLKRRQRAPNVGVLGEKTADGRPKPDERTVADLVERGWFKTEEEVEALLTKTPSRESRFPYETAKSAADWLEATLGLELLKGGLLPAAKAVNLFPELLCRDAAKLQRKWDDLTLSTEQGGVGVAFSEEQAREAVRKHPQILSYATDTFKRGWSMLTATKSALGLSPDEARDCILRSPEVLRFDHDAVVRRVELLRSLGYSEAYKMVLEEPRMLNFKEETVKEHVAWWKQSGLDHVKILRRHQTLLGSPSTSDLQARLDFVSRVAGMSTADLNKTGPLFHYRLNERLRARYFYALQEGKLADFTSMSTMLAETDATFLAMLQGLSSTAARANKASDQEVERYQELVASAKFVAWRERQEERILRARAGTDDAHDGQLQP